MQGSPQQQHDCGGLQGEDEPEAEEEGRLPRLVREGQHARGEAWRSPDEGEAEEGVLGDAAVAVAGAALVESRHGEGEEGRGSDEGEDHGVEHVPGRRGSPENGSVAVK